MRYRQAVYLFSFGFFVLSLLASFSVQRINGVVEVDISIKLLPGLIVLLMVFFSALPYVMEIDLKNKKSKEEIQKTGSNFTFACLLYPMMVSLSLLVWGIVSYTIYNYIYNHTSMASWSFAPFAFSSTLAILLGFIASYEIFQRKGASLKEKYNIITCEELWNKLLEKQKD